MAGRDEEITTWLRRWEEGNPDALDGLMPLVVAELKKTARAYLANERPDHTLQPTALLGEVYLRLMERRQVSWENRKTFFAFAAELMRRILVDSARRKRAKGRDAPVVPIALATSTEKLQSLDPETLIDLDQVLDQLKEADPQLAEIIGLRFFAGLTITETAQVLEIGESTVSKRWRLARIWLARELGSKAT